MSQAYSGVQANVHVGTTDVDAQGWTIDVSANTFDSTTTADGGWDDETPATLRIEGTFDFFYNAAKKPFGATNGARAWASSRTSAKRCSTRLEMAFSTAASSSAGMLGRRSRIGGTGSAIIAAITAAEFSPGNGSVPVRSS